MNFRFFGRPMARGAVAVAEKFMGDEYNYL